MARLTVGREKRPDPRLEERDGLLLGRCLRRSLARAQDRAYEEQTSHRQEEVLPKRGAQG
jgi:hypothetical protein